MEQFLPISGSETRTEKTHRIQTYVYKFKVIQIRSFTQRPRLTESFLQTAITTATS
ncbi:hypothetical protein Bhyg_07334, partial [Pseudolycoriella hygida]